MVPPIPIPGVSNSLLPGGKQIRKNKEGFFSMTFMKKLKLSFAGGLKKGSVAKKYENYNGRFPEGVQKEEIQQWR